MLIRVVVFAVLVPPLLLRLRLLFRGGYSLLIGGGARLAFAIPSAPPPIDMVVMGLRFVGRVAAVQNGALKTVACAQ